MTIFVILLLVLGHAAGPARARPASSPPHPGSPAIGHPGEGHLSSGTGTIRTIKLDMDLISFSAKSIVVSAGETIRFVLHNTSFTPHDFTIGPPATQQVRRDLIGEMLKTVSLDPDEGGSAKFDGPGATLVSPGQTKQLVWTFAETESLEFGCNVSGHYEMGMKGEILVRPPVVAAVVFATADRHPEYFPTLPHKHAPTIEQTADEKLHATPPVETKADGATPDRRPTNQAIEPIKPVPLPRTALLPDAKVHSQEEMLSKESVHHALKNHLEAAKARRNKLLLKHQRRLGEH